MSEEKKKGPLTLTCSSCKKVKMAGKKRWEKWKDKQYLCRECRKKTKKEGKEVQKENKEVKKEEEKKK